MGASQFTRPRPGCGPLTGHRSRCRTEAGIPQRLLAGARVGRASGVWSTSRLLPHGPRDARGRPVGDISRQRATPGRATGSVHRAVGRRIPCPFLLFSIPPGDVARRRRCPGITPAAAKHGDALPRRHADRRGDHRGHAPGRGGSPRRPATGSARRALARRAARPGGARPHERDLDERRGRCSCAAARVGAAARSGWTSGAGSSCGPGSCPDSSCRLGRCSASSTARLAGDPGQAPRYASSFAASPPRPVCGAGLHHTSSVTPRRLSSPARASR